MINRFKSALFNAVGQNETSSGNGNINGIVGDNNRRHHRLALDNVTTLKASRPVKHEYSRPHFLNLNTPDEIQVTADHAVRPIIVPRDLTGLPWNAGYAETINSGKSQRNEDQGRISCGFLEYEIGNEIVENGNIENDENATEAFENEKIKIPYRYFALFDGHAGPGAAVSAAAQLHKIVHKKLMQIVHHLVQDGPFCEITTRKNKKGKGIMWFPEENVTKDSLIVGALESAFYEMDSIIEEDNKNYEGVNGGCTAVMCLFILGKVYIANAGDSRAILCRRNADALALSQDFTPETERTRIRQLAARNPELLGNEFTSTDYLRRPVKSDLGSKILYRGAYMTGWAYKMATLEDLKFPVVFGQGKRSRVLATIGVTRGFGDHDLYAHSANTKIKPFLSSQPEVRILNIEQESSEIGEDDVILMGTDGLWDVTLNDKAASIVFNTLDQFPNTDPKRFKYRYTSAAQDLVMHARGKFNERNWKMSDGSAATIDDISVFVIPLWSFKVDIKEGRKIISSIKTKDNIVNANEVEVQISQDVVNGNEETGVKEQKESVGEESKNFKPIKIENIDIVKDEA